MPGDTPDETTGTRPPGKAGVLVRLGAICAVMLCAAGAFAYLGGWLSPDRLTPGRMVAALVEAGGNHPGFRRNHAKGVCIAGWFESNGQASALSEAAVFRPGRVPVVGRFALAGPMPLQTDVPVTVRSMALRFLPPGAEASRTGINNIPVFAVNSAQGFYDQLVASVPDPVKAKPDPARMKLFLARHPEAVRASALIKQHAVSSGFADSTFNSLDDFRFVSASGASVPVRWSTVPLQPFAAERVTQSKTMDKKYLFDDVVSRIDQGPLQ